MLTKENLNRFSKLVSSAPNKTVKVIGRGTLIKDTQEVKDSPAFKNTEKAIVRKDKVDD